MVCCSGGTIHALERHHSASITTSTGSIGAVTNAVIEVHVLAHAGRIWTSTSKGGILAQHVVETGLTAGGQVRDSGWPGSGSWSGCGGCARCLRRNSSRIGGVRRNSGAAVFAFKAEDGASNLSATGTVGAVSNTIVEIHVSA